MTEESEAVSRRRLLALAGTGILGSIAGCSGDDAADPTTRTTLGTTRTTRTATEATRTTEATETETTQTTEETETTTEETETQTTTEEPEPQTGPRILDRTVSVGVLDASPGSKFAPTDGFAAPSWLDGEVSVAVVTNLDASGEGSLRWAMNQSGPCIVVFEVGGVIDLAGDHLQPETDSTWIAGQTAPSPGITLVRGGLYVGGDEWVVQHVRVRAGDAGRTRGWEPDSAHSDDGTADNVFDHVSATWGVDETLSVGYNTQNTTLANCIVAEGLDESTHHEGGHSAGTLVGDGARNVALLGNLYANNVQRNPLMKYETSNVLVNNLVTHWEAEGALMLETTKAAFVGNAYTDAVHPLEPVIRRDGEAYFEDNRVASRGPFAEGITELDEPPLWPENLEAFASERTEEHVLANAGARPADRTHHDRRVVENARAREGAFIDTQSDVGGYPDLDATERGLDVPDDLSEWLTQHTRAVELADADPPTA